MTSNAGEFVSTVKDEPLRIGVLGLFGFPEYVVRALRDTRPEATKTCIKGSIIR